MKNDLLILSEGMEALKDKLGIVEAEKFISLIKRNPFNYTEWRKTLWENKSLDQLYNEAEEFYNFSLQNLGDAYSEDEPEYSKGDIIEHNKDYKE